MPIKPLNCQKSFKIITVAPTCFGLHKPSSGSSQPVLRQSCNVDIGYIYRYLKLSVMWAVMRVEWNTVPLHTVRDPRNRTDHNTQPQHR